MAERRIRVNDGVGEYETEKVRMWFIVDDRDPCIVEACRLAWIGVLLPWPLSTIGALADRLSWAGGGEATGETQGEIGDEASGMPFLSSGSLLTSGMGSGERLMGGVDVEAA